MYIFLHSEVLHVYRDISHFQSSGHRVLFMSFTMQNSRRLSVVCCVLKPEEVYGRFLKKGGGLYSFQWMNVVQHKGIHNFRNVKQKLWKQNLETEYSTDRFTKLQSVYSFPHVFIGNINGTSQGIRTHVNFIKRFEQVHVHLLLYIIVVKHTRLCRQNYHTALMLKKFQKVFTSIQFYQFIKYYANSVY